MNSTTVDSIIETITRLNPDDRETVYVKLDALREADFLREREQARLEAAADGIDDDAIDRAIEQVRYGR